MCVEKDEDSPRVRVELLERALRGEIHVTSEGDVFEHKKEISCGETAQDAIDVIPSHFLLTEDDDVENVDHHANYAGYKTQTSVSQLKGAANPLNGNTAIVFRDGWIYVG